MTDDAERDGGPAFARSIGHGTLLEVGNVSHNIEVGPQAGMSLRDYFASQALQFLQVDGAYGDYVALASAAYRVADAMLAERAK